MKSTPSPRARFLAVLALVLLAGAGAYVLMKGSNSASDTAGTKTTLPKTTQTTTAQTKTTAKQSTTTRKSKKRRRRAPVEGVNALDAALAAHPLVVVSVYAKNVATDDQAMKEARAGAARAGAGFVAFNVFDEKIARQVADLLSGDATSNPEVLFFKRGRQLVFKLQGFSDSQVVAQAARNVYPHTEPWVGQANAICDRYAPLLDNASSFGFSFSTQLQPGGKTSSSSTSPHLGQMSKLLNSQLQALSAVRVPVSEAAHYKLLIADIRQADAFFITSYKPLVKAYLHGDHAEEQRILNQAPQSLNSIGPLMTELQLTSCALE